MNMRAIGLFEFDILDVLIYYEGLDFSIRLRYLTHVRIEWVKLLKF